MLLQKHWLFVCLIIIVTLVVYRYAPQAGFIPIDDRLLSYENPLVTEMTPESIHGIFSSYDPELYIPITLLSYKLDYFIGKENPAIYHIRNLLLHIFNAILVFLLLKRLTSRDMLAMLTALLFAIHPLNTETVMWVAARKDVLSAFFFLSTLLLYCRSREHESRALYYGSILCFALALMSKVVTATLPLVLMIIDDLQGYPNDRSATMQKIPYGVLSFVFLGIGLFKKSLAVYSISYGETFLLAGKSTAFYVQKLLIPTEFMPLYQQHLPIEPLSMEFIAPFAVIALLGVIAIAARSIEKAVSFGILWYGITLLPNLANFTHGAGWKVVYASDRYAYLPSIGLMLMFCVGLLSLPKKRVILPLGTVIIAILSVLSMQQSLRWQSTETLFIYVVERAPQTHIAHALLGIYDMENDHFEAALPHLEKSVEIAPDFPFGRANYGLALIETGKVEAGIAELKETLRRAPDYVQAYLYLAYAYDTQDKLQESVYALQSVLSLEPDNAEASRLLESIGGSGGI